MKDLSTPIAKLMGISGKGRHMDSMMTESNIRKHSRMELTYTCIAKLAMYIDKTDDTVLPDDLKHYVDSNDFNRAIYQQRSTNADKFLTVCESEYQYEQNIHSDSQFIREYLDRMDVQEEKTVIAANGAESSSLPQKESLDALLISQKSCCFTTKYEFFEVL